MPTEPATMTRPYLREGQRRRHLLDATVRLVCRVGIEGVTMSALAREAGVSRQLVYDHFADLATLFDAFLDDRVQHYGAHFDEACATVRDPSQRTVEMFRRALTLPREELRIVRMLIVGTGGPDLDQARDRLRRHVIARWFDIARPHSPNDAQAALVWAMAAALISIADQVVRGEITESTGVAIVRAITSDPAQFRVT